MKENLLDHKVGMAIALAWLSSIPGAITTLGAFTFLDLLFGLMEHYVNRDLCSIEARSGSVRKLMQLMVAYIVVVAEAKLGFTSGIGAVFCGYLTLMEVLSIFEHCAIVGIPIPEPLLKALVNVRDAAPRTMSKDEVLKALRSKKK